MKHHQGSFLKSKTTTTKISPSSPLRALLGHLLPLDEAGELDDQPDEAEDDDDQRQDGEQQQPPTVPHDDQVFCFEPTIGSAGCSVLK